MRRSLCLLFLIAVSCGRERAANPPQARRNVPPPVSPAPSVSRLPTTNSAPPAKALLRPTPARCAGDGSYEAALDCLRITNGFHFVLSDGPAHAVGDMSRARVGDERLRFTLAGDGEWTAITKPQGIVWYHARKRSTEPAVADTIWQHTTLILDPQKKEGTPQLAGTAVVDSSECNRYTFTDANTADQHEVWVNRKSGDLEKVRIVPAPQFRSQRHELVMTLSKQGRGIVIDEPK